jgi:hypothetical protein
MRKRWIAAGIVLMGIVGLHLSSPKRDLEVALGVKRLPGSLKHERVRTDSWTDYSVDAYFQIHPEDMRRLLTVRPYAEVQAPRTLEMEIGEFRPPTPASFFPDVPGFDVKHLLEWQPDPDGFLRCQIWVSGDFTKAYLHYTAD